jgi:Concanavalin A-like lectin/glucanases superfamily
MADGGGQIAHDIGSAKFHIPQGAAYGSLGYSGPIGNGGSWYIVSAQFPQTANALASITSPFSFEMWFWPAVTPATNSFLLQYDGVGLPEMQALYLTTNKVQFSVNNSVVVSAGTYARQAWHHLVGTYDGTNVRAYVDALIIGTTALAGPVTIAKAASFGGTAGSGANFFNGCVAEIAIYNVTLSPTRINAHFLAADNSIGVPVYGAAGGISGGSGPGADFTTIEQQILSSVRKIY